MNFDLTSKIVQLIHRLSSLEEPPGAEPVAPLDDFPLEQSLELEASGVHPILDKVLKLSVVVKCDAVNFRVAETVGRSTFLHPLDPHF